MWNWMQQWCHRARVEIWESPLQDRADLEFVGMWVGDAIHFWFLSGDSLFSIKIPRRSPFRLVDEAYLGRLHRHLNTNSRTWKVFRSPFLSDLEKTILFHQTDPKDRFAYLVLTGDECLEFVSPEPQIEKYTLHQLPELTQKVPEFFSWYLSSDKI